MLLECSNKWHVILNAILPIWWLDALQNLCFLLIKTIIIDNFFQQNFPFCWATISCLNWFHFIFLSIYCKWFVIIMMHNYKIFIQIIFSKACCKNICHQASLVMLSYHQPNIRWSLILYYLALAWTLLIYKGKWKDCVTSEVRT